MLVSKTLPQAVAFLVFVLLNPLQGLQFLLIPPESPPSFQSTEIGVNIDILMCVFTHIRINNFDFITSSYKLIQRHIYLIITLISSGWLFLKNPAE